MFAENISENISCFANLIDLILRWSSVGIEKLESALFVLVYARRMRPRPSLVFLTRLAYVLDLLRLNCIGIGPIRSPYKMETLGYDLEPMCSTA